MILEPRKVGLWLQRDKRIHLITYVEGVADEDGDVQLVFAESGIAELVNILRIYGPAEEGEEDAKGSDSTT